MSDNQHLPLAPSHKKTDARVRRTRDALGDALIALMQEKPFEQTTQILCNLWMGFHSGWYFVPLCRLLIRGSLARIVRSLLHVDIATHSHVGLVSKRLQH